MFTTVSARQIQREYKKVLQKANKSKEPIVVMANNKPLGAIVGLEILERLQIEAALSQALEDHKVGRTKTISTMAGLEADFAEMRKEADS